MLFYAYCPEQKVGRILTWEEISRRINKMDSGKVFWYGFLIWIIMFFIGWFLMGILPSTMSIILVFIGILLIYSFSRSIVYEKSVLKIGLIWFLISFVLDFAIIILVLGNHEYYMQWSVWAFYILLVMEPVIVKKLSE